MTLPLPPTVHGPITPFSPSVQVTGVLANAEVQLFAGGRRIGTTIAGVNGTVWVPVDQAPAVGDAVTATQQNDDGESGPSPGVAVIDLPQPLPSPIFISPLSNAMSSLRLGGLIPGALVEVSNNGAVAGQSVVSDTSAWIDIAPGASLGNNSIMVARQQLGGHSSAAVGSLPIIQINRELQLPAPGIAQPVAACDTSITVTSAVASADLVADNEGTALLWHNVGEAYGAWGAPPLEQGKLVAHQAFPRFNLKGPDTTIPVGPPATPGQPVIQGDICPEVAQVKISNLAPGGTILVSTIIPDPNTPGAVISTPIGTAGVSAATETFNLPAGLQPVTPQGAPVLLVAQQTRCGLTGLESARTGFAAPGGPYTTIIIAGPIYACTGVVVLQSAHPGAQVVATSGNTGQPLGDPVLVSDPTVFYRTWLPLPDNGDTVVITQSGCNANSTAKEPIQRLPNPLPVPQIKGPVRPAAPSIYATGFARGAVAHLLVNGHVRVSQETQYSDAWIAVPAPPLVEGDNLTIIQTLCAEASAFEQRGTPVARGHLKVALSPATVTRTTNVVVTVSAKDADTGVDVAGQVLLDGKVVGTTGTGFAFAPVAGQPNPAGLVKSPPQYFDEPFSIGLVDPPPPTAKLHLALSPVVIIYQQLVLSSAEWTVTPMWNPGAKVTASGATATVNLPRPPGGSGNVQIKLVAKWGAAGWIQGYLFSGTVGGEMAPVDPTVVVWDGQERNVGYLATYRVDPGGNGSLHVIESYQGIQ
jgi:hypothetical protein